MLEIDGLGHRYPRAAQDALHDLSLRVERGRIHGLLGPNGAGKSTLVAHLAGLLPIQRGSIRVGGVALAEARRRDPTRIAVAPQDYAFYPSLTVAENLACFAAANRLRGQAAAAAVAQCLALARLEGHAGVAAARLSGGFKRRLNLAIALLGRPDLVVLDEPTVGVDPESRTLLLAAVRALAVAGTAVIYTSHYLEEIEAIADSVAIVHRGRLLRDGTLGALLGDERTRVSVTLDREAPPALNARLAGFGAVHARGAQLAVELAPGASPTALLGAIEAAGAAIRDARWGRERLEDLFMRLTGDEACSPR